MEDVEARLIENTLAISTTPGPRKTLDDHIVKLFLSG